MRRIKEQDLQRLIDNLNELCGTPKDAYSKVNDKFTAQIGNYHLSGAYGCVALHQMVNENGGIRDVFSSGHMSKRDLYNVMHAYRQGLISAKEGN